MDSDSYSKQQLDDLFMDMIAYYDGDPKRIQHFTKVHSYARLIGIGEELDDASLFILEAAAYTHDIGIRVAEEKYGRCDGKLQEQEGPIIAQKMLSQLGFENYIVERICFLIGHHHTYDNIDGLDYQILVEADFLVNLYEDDAGKRAIDKAYKRIFKTETGKKIFRLMFGYEEED
ncbi:HD domain-containing protein [Agathobacter rectalis]|uniref:HD domain-containing protein n=1 Tax=Agathobacter rectalis TaxID=39491 RepID=A0A412Q742_9FIRM|nr:HD domain-containing protein [Agathobacter rectalis]RGT79048.1 HD domain-containing protein [Agathobacter rectalis]RGT84202.1 HD domain-containing protein [Agathobacter rectalis]